MNEAVSSKTTYVKWYALACYLHGHSSFGITHTLVESPLILKSMPPPMPIVKQTHAMDQMFSMTLFPTVGEQKTNQYFS